MMLLAITYCRQCTVQVLFLVVEICSVHASPVPETSNTTPTDCGYLHYQRRLSNGTWDCVPCSECPPGQGTDIECNGTQDMVCRKCKEGSYSTEYKEYTDNGYVTTRVCSECSACGQNKKVLQKCTKNHDVKCGGCKEGYHLDEMSDDCLKDQHQLNMPHQRVQMTLTESVTPTGGHIHEGTDFMNSLNPNAFSKLEYPPTKPVKPADDDTNLILIGVCTGLTIIILVLSFECYQLRRKISGKEAFSLRFIFCHLRRNRKKFFIQKSRENNQIIGPFIGNELSDGNTRQDNTELGPNGRLNEGALGTANGHTNATFKEDDDDTERGNTYNASFENPEPISVNAQVYRDTVTDCSEHECSQETSQEATTTGQNNISHDIASSAQTRTDHDDAGEPSSQTISACGTYIYQQKQGTLAANMGEPDMAYTDSASTRPKETKIDEFEREDVSSNAGNTDKHGDLASHQTEETLAADSMASLEPPVTSNEREKELLHPSCTDECGNFVFEQTDEEPDKLCDENSNLI